MKIKLVFFLFLFSVSTFGKKIEKIYTKDLVQLSSKVGLDSALQFIKLKPIYYIDIETSQVLREHSLTNSYSEDIMYFLSDYALNIKDNESAKYLFHILLKEKHEIKTFKSNEKNELPVISTYLINAIVENPYHGVDSLLIKYYQEWEKKMESIYNNKSNYEPNQFVSIIHDCHLNCFKVLLTLDSLNSTSEILIKQQTHKRFLEDWEAQRGITKYTDFYKYDEEEFLFQVQLNTPLYSLNDLNINKVTEIKKLLKGYRKGYSWYEFLCSDHEGYLDVGHIYGNLGSMNRIYRLELKNNSILVYLITTIQA